jgi:putative transcription antitermination factor YqgF
MRQLTERFQVPVHGTEERMSTMEAQSQLREQRRSGQRRKRVSDGDLDMTAARLILEHWIHDHPSERS